MPNCPSRGWRWAQSCRSATSLWRKQTTLQGTTSTTGMLLGSQSEVLSWILHHATIVEVLAEQIQQAKDKIRAHGHQAGEDMRPKENPNHEAALKTDDSATPTGANGLLERSRRTAWGANTLHADAMPRCRERDGTLKISADRPRSCGEHRVHTRS